MAQKIVNTVTVPIKLVPLCSYTSGATGKKYYEQILAYHNDYPVFMFHSDTLWKKDGDNSIYNELDKGETITVNLTISHEIELEEE